MAPLSSGPDGTAITMLPAIDRQYPTDQDKQRLARQILNQVLRLAGETVEIAGELGHPVSRLI